MEVAQLSMVCMHFGSECELSELEDLKSELSLVAPDVIMECYEGFIRYNVKVVIPGRTSDSDVERIKNLCAEKASYGYVGASRINF